MAIKLIGINWIDTELLWTDTEFIWISSIPLIIEEVNWSDINNACWLDTIVFWYPGISAEVELMHMLLTSKQPKINLLIHQPDIKFITTIPNIVFSVDTFIEQIESINNGVKWLDRNTISWFDTEISWAQAADIVIKNLTISFIAKQPTISLFNSQPTIEFKSIKPQTGFISDVLGEEIKSTWGNIVWLDTAVVWINSDTVWSEKSIPSTQTMNVLFGTKRLGIIFSGYKPEIELLEKQPKIEFSKVE